MFKIINKNWKLLGSSVVNPIDCFKVFTQVKYFSGGHNSHSDSDSDHHHNHTSTGTSSSETSETEDHLSLLRSRAFSKVPKKVPIDNVLEQAKIPITRQKEKFESVPMFQNEGEYINFLAKEFRLKALVKYPGYDSNVEEFKHKILDYDRLNPYQREVQTLNIFLLHKLDKEREELTKAFQGTLTGSSLQQARSRLNLMESN